jgi:hypothetical protein
VKADRADVTAVLKDQHRQICRAFSRAGRPRGRGRSRAFYELVQLLPTHEAAEQAHIHPTTRRAGRTIAAAARVAEEKQVKELLGPALPGRPARGGLSSRAAGVAAAALPAVTALGAMAAAIASRSGRPRSG